MLPTAFRQVHIQPPAASFGLNHQYYPQIWLVMFRRITNITVFCLNTANSGHILSCVMGFTTESIGQGQEGNGFYMGGLGEDIKRVDGVNLIETLVAVGGC